MNCKTKRQFPLQFVISSASRDRRVLFPPGSMVHFLFIRHGESKDNLLRVWAGWKNSALSNHGVRQAEALSEDLKHVRISAIFSSDLLRAKTTANIVREKQFDPMLPFHESTLLREQNFGAGEGMKFSKKETGLSIAAHYAKGKFPALYTRHERFPGGESLDDVTRRADTVIDEILVPQLLQEREDGLARTVAIFSHGLFIGELIVALIRRDRDYKGDADVRNLGGMKNTAWTRLEVKIKEGPPQATSSCDAATTFTVMVTGINRHAHLSNLHRQKGGIGSLAHDPAQQDIRTFLGKQKFKPPRKTPY